MKINLLVLVIFSLQLSLNAQDYLTGKLAGSFSGEQQVFYDRTQRFISKNNFQSVYKIFDRNKNLRYTITLSHDRAKPGISIAIKPTGLAASVNMVRYERAKSGLLLSNRGGLDTVFNLSTSYEYLFSFSDTLREYPVLHKIKLPDGKDALLDPVTKLLLKRHKVVVYAILSSDPAYQKQQETEMQKQQREREVFKAQVLKMRDSMYSRSSMFAERVSKMKTGIDNDISVMFKTPKVYPDARRYEGQKRKGEAEGNGLFMSNSNYYDGFFRAGKFVSGTVMIHYDAFEYCGDYSFDSLNGVGRLTYKDGSFLLGIFKEGVLYDGIGYYPGKSGEVFSGIVKNGHRTGYGELYNTRGEKYYGEFRDGTLVKGYLKDVDPFGVFVYSRTEGGIKTPIGASEGEDFFNPLAGARQ